MIPGTDISTWQNIIVFGDARWCAERVATAFGQDTRNNQHRNEIKARGIPRWAYFAAYPGDGAKQAGMLLAYAGDAIGLAFDGREFGALDPEAKDFFDFLDRNDPLRRDTWQYRDMRFGGQIANGQDHNWTAVWGPTPPPGLVPGDLWQNTGGGSGYSGDHNFFIGTEADFARATKMPPAQPAPDIDLSTVNLVKADYFHAIKLRPGAEILTTAGKHRSTASGGEVLAWIGADNIYWLLSDGSTLALVRRVNSLSVPQGDRYDPPTPIHIAVGN